MSENPKLLVLDGHSMAFRAFYALPPESFINDAGQHTNAVHGFTSMLLTLIRQQKPTHVAVAFDLDTPTFRSEEYTEYKAGREKTPEEFSGQVDLIIQVMQAMNIPTISLDGYEADDILATLSAMAENAEWNSLVVSGDRDAFQLITDRTLVLYPKKGISDIPPMDAAAVEEKYGVSPAQYPDLAALVGESADNLPGVPGVGPKTAAKWIQQYGGLEEILENADQIKGKVGEKLRDHLEDVKRNRRLNRLVRDLKLSLSLDDLLLQRPDREKIEELFDVLQFKTLRTRVFDTYDLEAPAPAAELTTPEVSVLRTEAELSQWYQKYGSFEGATHGSSAVAVSVIGPELALADPVRLDVQGIGLSTTEATAYIPILELDAAAEKALATWLAGSTPKAVHDLKLTIKALSGRSLEFTEVVDDTSISAYLIQPERRDYDLPALAEVHLQTPLPQEEPQKAGQLDLDFDDAAAGERRQAEAAVKAYATAKLHEKFMPMLQERQAMNLLQDLELPLARVLARMELDGVAVSESHLDELMSDYQAVITRAQESAYAEIGHSVNLGSPKQLQTVLFDELDMPKTKKIKTGYSTDAEALADLQEKHPHPFLEQLQIYRDTTKLKQTVEGLQKFVNTDSRIHTTYAQNIAATGRLSSNNPNLQNIPIRSAEGRRIRECFVVGDGYETLLTADYSQIEMRIMAHLSEDPGLIQAFHEGEDLHRFVGSHIFEVPPEEVTAAMRSKVKAMSYGLAYGLSSFGLSKQLRISMDESRTLMRDYFERFGGVRDYLRTVVEQARVDGYTTTIEGRRRYLPDLTSDNRHLRDIAERVALNSPIQGSAADIIKCAMLGVDKRFRELDLRSRMLLQVHDELVFEVASGEQEKVTQVVTEEMAAAAELKVPMEVQIGVGKNWFTAGH